MKKIPLIACVLALGFALTQAPACRKEPGTRGLTPLQLTVPPGFPQPNNIFADNPLTQEGFELGRRLFYEGLLSVDTAHPCSSCHQQVAAFGTFEHDRSHGVYNSHTLRNAPPLFNLAWAPVLHWDGEYKSLTEEATQPINGHIEMGEKFKDVIDRLQAIPDYRERFKQVFKYPFIRPEFITKALAQFTGSFVSANSRFDQYKAGTATLNSTELNGYQIYKDKCSSCHPEPLFTDFEFHNNGLPVDALLNDYGRMRITGLSSDSLKFRTPSLRNVQLTSNYMHDGRFITTGQVLNHYKTNVQAGPTLDPRLNGGIALTPVQTVELLNFLNTLTDSSFIRDPRFKNPF